jgi:hypothetical protein
MTEGEEFRVTRKGFFNRLLFADINNAAMCSDKIKEAIAALGRLVKGATLQQ